MKLNRINVGCGQTPTNGWLNFDNTPSIVLAQYPSLVAIASAMGLLKPQHLANISFFQKNQIRRCDVRRRIPVGSSSSDVVYASHMVEHLDKSEALMFFKEVQRILISGGVIRLALPDFRWHVDNYIQDGDCDRIVRLTKLGRILPKGIVPRLKFLILGEREHHIWMYDPPSAVRLLREAGFRDVVALAPGQTGIQSPGALDLFERVPESLFVEGRNP
jgi:hypothetical protein